MDFSSYLRLFGSLYLSGIDFMTISEINSNFYKLVNSKEFNHIWREICSKELGLRGIKKKTNNFKNLDKEKL